MNNHNSFAYLPPHIIVNILAFLNLKDFKNAVQLCKQWYNASCCSTVGRRIKIRFIGDINSSYKCINRPFNRLTLSQVNLTRWNYKEFLKKFSYTIRELQITRCHITFNKLVKCIKYLPHLETLQIELCGDTKFKITRQICSNLPNTLSNIKIFCVECFADQCAGVNVLLGKCTQLQELSYDADSSLNSYDNSKIHINMCQAMARWPHVNLNLLEITNRATDMNSFFKGFCGLNNVIAVRKLKLFEIPSDYDRGEFSNFCKKIPGLEELVQVNNLDSERICQCSLNLRLSRVHKFHGRQLSGVNGPHNLQENCISEFSTTTILK